MIDWTGVFSRLIPRGVGNSRGGRKATGEPRHAWLTGPAWGAAWGVGCMFLVLKVNPFLGALAFCALARRASDFAPSERSRVRTRMSCLDCYVVTLTTLGDSDLAGRIQHDFGLRRAAGDSHEEAARIALWASRHDIREAGVNLPCFDKPLDNAKSSTKIAA